jgi:hypothetical protein
MSDPRIVSTGVPTGSILGPLPANLPLEANEMIFADDTTLFVQNTREDDLLINSREALSRAQVWYNSNRLHLYSGKTQEIIFSLRQVNLPSNPPSVKLLGFYIDTHLKWHAHIDYVAGKLNGRLFLLNKLKSQVSPTTLKNAYFIPSYRTDCCCGTIHHAAVNSL